MKKSILQREIKVGKVSGFLEHNRVDRSYESADKRVKHFKIKEVQ